MHGEESGRLTISQGVSALGLIVGVVDVSSKPLARRINQGVEYNMLKGKCCEALNIITLFNKQGGCHVQRI
jgi:hypothetical protein